MLEIVQTGRGKLFFRDGWLVVCLEDLLIETSFLRYVVSDGLLHWLLNL